MSDEHPLSSFVEDVDEAVLAYMNEPPETRAKIREAIMLMIKATRGDRFTVTACRLLNVVDAMDVASKESWEFAERRLAAEKRTV